MSFLNFIFPFHSISSTFLFILSPGHISNMLCLHPFCYSPSLVSSCFGLPRWKSHSLHPFTSPNTTTAIYLQFRPPTLWFLIANITVSSPGCSKVLAVVDWYSLKSKDVYGNKYMCEMLSIRSPFWIVTEHTSLLQLWEALQEGHLFKFVFSSLRIC